MLRNLKLILLYYFEIFRYFSNIFYRRPAGLIISGFPSHKKTFENIIIDREKKPYVSKSTWKENDGQGVNL